MGRCRPTYLKADGIQGNILEVEEAEA